MMLLSSLFPIICCCVLYGSANIDKGMRNSLLMAKHMAERSKHQGLKKHRLLAAVAPVSLRENVYNQIYTPHEHGTCGASAWCSMKGGICMTNDQVCPGQVHQDLCTGCGCICCIIPKCSCPRKCRPSRCCKRRGGTCIAENQSCNGKLRPRLCRGGSCTCCIEVKTPPTTTPTATTIPPTTTPTATNTPPITTPIAITTTPTTTPTTTIPSTTTTIATTTTPTTTPTTTTTPPTTTPIETTTTPTTTPTTTTTLPTTTPPATTTLPETTLTATTPAATTTPKIDCVYDGVGYRNGECMYIGCVRLCCENNTLVPKDGVNSDCVECQVYNDPHFLTFEGTSYNWHQQCNFSLVQNTQDDYPDYAVYGDFGDCPKDYKSRPACVNNTVLMDTQANTFRFNHESLENMIVNGVEQEIPTGGNVDIYGETLVWVKIVDKGKKYVRILMDNSVHVEILNRKITIWIPSRLLDSEHGLCRFKGGQGPYGNTSELAGCEKYDADDEACRKRVEEFALSWRAKLQENSNCKVETRSFVDPDLCAGKNKTTMQMFLDHCRTSIENVAPHIPVELKDIKIESCVQDLCVCENETACLEEVSIMAENDEDIQNHVFTPPASGCGSPFFEVQDKLVQVCNQRTQWEKAQEICREGDADLLSLEKIVFFDELVQRSEMAGQRGSTFWVNARYHNSSSSYNWTSGREIIHGWLPTEPSAIITEKQCVIFNYYGKWPGMADRDCKLKRKFICAREDDGVAANFTVGCGSPFIKVDDMLVQVCDETRTWMGARTLCMDAGADLISITRTQLFKGLSNMPELANSGWWIGGHYNQSTSSYFWSSGEEIGRGWLPGKPFREMSECVALGLWTRRGGLTDRACSSLEKFICVKANIYFNTGYWGGSSSSSTISSSSSSSSSSCTTTTTTTISSSWSSSSSSSSSSSTTTTTTSTSNTGFGSL